MRSTPYPSIADVAADAAAGSVVTDYLTARGIRTVPTLALMAKTEDDLDRHVIQPLFSGWVAGTTRHEAPREEQPIVQAILLHMWNTCRNLWAAQQAAAVPTPSAPTPAISASATSKADDKVPRSLPTGVWTNLLNSYNKAQLHGQDRCFPQHELVSSEVTLARMNHEHQVTKMYSPIPLGEIVQRRSFTPSGDVNPLSAKSRTPKALTIEDDQLTYVDDPTTWTPRSLLAALDGLQSIKFAMIFVQWGSESSVERLFAWLVQRARSRPNKMENFNLYFIAISWQLCMDLRQGLTFEEASTNIMNDLDKFTEFMARDLPTPNPKKPTPKLKGGERGEKGDKGWGKNSKGDKGKYNRYQPYYNNRRYWQQDSRQEYNKDETWRTSDTRPDWKSTDKSQK